MYTKHFNDTLLLRTNDVTCFDEAIRELVNLTGSWDEFNEGLPKGEDCTDILRYLVSLFPPIPKTKLEYLRKVILDSGSCVGERELNCMNEMMVKALFCGFDWETKVEKIQDYAFDKTWSPVFYKNKIAVKIQSRGAKQLVLFEEFNFDDFVNDMIDLSHNLRDLALNLALTFEYGIFYQMVKPDKDKSNLHGPFDNTDQAFVDAFENYGLSLVTK